jgi:hypothetical protein
MVFTKSFALSRTLIAELAERYADAAYRQYQATGVVDLEKLNDAIRERLLDHVFSDVVDHEFNRVMKIVWQVTPMQEFALATVRLEPNPMMRAQPGQTKDVIQAISAGHPLPSTQQERSNESSA